MQHAPRASSWPRAVPSCDTQHLIYTSPAELKLDMMANACSSVFVLSNVLVMSTGCPHMTCAQASSNNVQYQPRCSGH